MPYNTQQRSNLSVAKPLVLALLTLAGLIFSVLTLVVMVEISSLYLHIPIPQDLIELARQVETETALHKWFGLEISYYIKAATVCWPSWIVFGASIALTLAIVLLVANLGQSRYYETKMHQFHHSFDLEKERRRQGDTRLAAFDHQLVSAYAHGSEGLILLDENIIVKHVNDQGARLLQIWAASGNKTIIGSRLFDLLPGLANTEVQVALQNCVITNNAWEGEIKLSRIETWLTVRIFPGMQGSFMAFRDITHRKQPTDVLQVAETLFKQTVKSTPMPVAIVDAEWNYTVTSDKWLRQFNLGSKSLRGKNHKDLLPTFPGKWAQIEEQLTQGRNLKNGAQQFNINGQEEWINWEVRPWRNNYNKIGGYILFADIVTEEMQAEIRDKSQREQEKMLAYHDSLTGLPNRQLFNDRLNMGLAQAYRQLGRVGLMFLDLDGFKAVNDTLGHEMGDLLLKEVGERLKQCVRQTDTVARLGGDEFTIILSDVKGTEDIEMVANKIIGAIAAPYVFNNQEARVTTSLGISIYPENTTSSTEMIRQADAAMYQAKKAGKNSYKFFTEGQSEETRGDYEGEDGEEVVVQGDSA